MFADLKCALSLEETFPYLTLGQIEVEKVAARLEPTNEVVVDTQERGNEVAV
jgi:hypothetical protein